MAESLDVDGPIILENFKIEPQEWVRVMYTYNLSKAMLGVVGYLAGVVGLVSLAYPPGWPYYLATAVCGLAIIFAARWSNMQKTTRDPLNRAAWQNRQFEFDELEMRVAAADGTRSQIPVKNLVLCRDLGNYYMLHYTRAQSFMIPRSAFKRPGDEAAFRQVLYKHNLLTTLEKK